MLGCHIQGKLKPLPSSVADHTRYTRESPAEELTECLGYSFGGSDYGKLSKLWPQPAPQPRLSKPQIVTYDVN